ncbi:hypothetical protein YB2330_002749 [Saitoella coloradoensis]
MSVQDERISIPGPLGEAIVGQLRVNDPQSNKCILILHGHLGHKDYLFLKYLAEEYEGNSFRLDFRGNGESDGDWDRPRLFKDDYADLDAVTDYLRRERQYQFYAIVGHSRGGQVALLYAHHRPDLRIPLLVNASGRYFGSGLRDRYLMRSKTMAEEGGATDKIKVKHTGEVKAKRTPWEEIDANSNIDLSVIEHFPPDVNVLTVMGTRDHIVPPNEVQYFANLLAGRHTLQLVEGADHNYYAPSGEPSPHLPDLAPRHNFNPDVAKYISNWLSSESERKRFWKRSQWIGGTRRFKMDVEGTANFRDLGGWKNEDEQWVRKGWIFRSADLCGVTERGADVMRKLNIKVAYDLRSDPELKKSGWGELEGLQRCHNPVFKEEDYSPEKLAQRFANYHNGIEGFLKAYKTILQHGGHAFRTILLHLRDRPDEGLVIHCKAGKDRTGVICALILKLAGVDDETVAREYELTTEGLKDEHDKIIASLPTSSDEDLNNPKKAALASLMSSKHEAMAGTLKMLQERFGGAERYVKEYCGMTDEDLKKIRENLLVGSEVDWVWRHQGRARRNSQESRL